MRPEVWGGPEYTCNRVGDQWFDQMRLSGHDLRFREDLPRFAELGITALRCGILWERHCRRAGDDWRWADAYLHAVRAAGMRPIVGLVHHGSGPPHAGIQSEGFAEGLAAYAGEVAQRYPWVESYTPVNEPNTTARFAGLYGLWHPHGRTHASYLRALVHETRATVESMRAIRQVRSDAKLIQTDDLGRIRSTEPLAATRDLLNERRWLGWDLLCGRVDHAHPLWAYLRTHGLGEYELLWFRDNPCPPDVVGVNWYATSDRFLDHRLHAYPRRFRSAEGPYADVEAVRVHPESLEGFGAVAREARARYGIPVAITEVHLGDCVEEQIRWTAEAWAGARESGCLAMTFWALLGSFFWSALVTRDNGDYEPGAFDLTAGSPRETALADLIRQCARGEALEHPALGEPGWWQRPCRIQYEPDAELVA